MGTGYSNDDSHYLHRDEVNRDARTVGEIPRHIQDPSVSECCEK